jgi:hypothetical protein
MSPTTAAPGRSGPCKVFDANLTRLIGLAKHNFEPLNQTIIQVHSAVKPISPAIQEVTDKVRSISSRHNFGGVQPELDSIADEIKLIGQRIAPLGPLFDQVRMLSQSTTFLSGWMIVMLVTFAEAYLDDVLGLLITNGFAGTTLPASVSDEMKRKWVKEVLRGGSPHQWINKLTEFGVTGYASTLHDQLRDIWQRRHRIVHSAEVPNMAMTEFTAAATVVNTFINTTDAFIAASCPNP